LTFSRPPRFDLLLSPRAYTSELLYFSDLYANLSKLGEMVAETRNLVKQSPEFRDFPDDKINMAQAKQALSDQSGESKRKLESAIAGIQALNVPGMKAGYQAQHYQIFLDYPTDFTKELPMLINGFFNSFGAGFVQ
jgi:hypothetical protein